MPVESAEGAGFVINRVVLTLGSVCNYLRSIEVAADLADRLRAGLRGVFVEDEALLTIAELPFTRQVALGGQPTRPLERGAVEAEFRALARQARHCMARIAANRRLTWSFEVVKGERPGFTPAIERNELLVMETRCRAFAGHVRLPANLTMPTETGARTTALLGSSAARASRVVAIIDDSLLADRALGAALELIGGEARALTIFYPKGISRKPEIRRGAEPNAPVIRSLDALSTATIRRVLREEAAGILVMPLSLAEKEKGALAEFLADPPCTVLLVG